MLNRKNAIRGIYLGEQYEPKSLPVNKYPKIETNDKGYFTDLHKWEQEKHREKMFAFYPDKWGHIYYFTTNADKVKKLEKAQTELFEDSEQQKL